MNKENRKTLIIGGSGDIGKHIASKLLDDGYEILCTYNNSDVQIANCQKIRMDLTALNVEVLKKLEGITDIIFAAGKESAYSITNCPLEEMNLQFLIHVFSPLSIIQVLYSTNPIKNIVFISSNSATKLHGYNGLYALSKASVHNLIHILDDQFKRDGRNIRINAISCGWCDTQMTNRVLEVKKTSLKKIRAKKLDNQIISSEEVAELSSFLLSDYAKHIHGVVLEMDSMDIYKEDY